MHPKDAICSSEGRAVGVPALQAHDARPARDRRQRVPLPARLHLAVREGSHLQGATRSRSGRRQRVAPSAHPFSPSQVRRVSLKSKKWVADPANRRCEVDDLRDAFVVPVSAKQWTRRQPQVRRARVVVLRWPVPARAGAAHRAPEELRAAGGLQHQAQQRGRGVRQGVPRAHVWSRA